MTDKMDRELSLGMFRRIAASLDRRIEIRFVPIRHKSPAPADQGLPAP
jgi:hypothetical protein